MSDCLANQNILESDPAMEAHTHLHTHHTQLVLGKSMPEEMNALLRKYIKRGCSSSMTSEGYKGLTDWKAGQLKPKLACRQKDLSCFQGEQHGVVDLKWYRLEEECETMLREKTSWAHQGNSEI